MGILHCTTQSSTDFIKLVKFIVSNSVSWATTFAIQQHLLLTLANFLHHQPISGQFFLYPQ